MDARDGPIGATVSHAEPEGVGAYLRARRLALGLTHADIANVVKLPARRIEALEEERWSELPDGPYLRGFLRNVARALDLDAATLMDRVDASLMRSRNPESILVTPVHTTAMLPRRNGPVADRHGGRALVFGAFAFAVVAALIAWSGTESFERIVGRPGALASSLVTSRDAATPAATHDDDKVSEPIAVAPTVASPAAVATPPAATGVAPGSPTPANPASSTGPAAVTTTPVPGATPTTTAPTATAAPGAADVALVFHFTEDSWVEVKSATGRVLLQRLNAAGSDQTVDGEAPYSLIVGNAKGVALRFHGQPVDLGPYTRDQVARLTLS